MKIFKTKRLCLIAVFSLVSTQLVSSCQNIKKDPPQAVAPFINLGLNDWIIKYEEDSTYDSYFSTNISGHLKFILAKDTTVDISYTVFDLKIVNDTFKAKEIEYYMIQSCLSFVTDPGLSSFSIEDFYYQLNPCNSCKVEDLNNCNSLSKKLFKLVTE